MQHNTPHFPRKPAYLVTVLLILTIILFHFSAAVARADGEFYLSIGEKFPLPCLTHLAGGQEYEILIENPDIVGLDETGKSIVGAAAGNTEVTVVLYDPGAVYLYVFAVQEYDTHPSTIDNGNSVIPEIEVYEYEETDPDAFRSEPHEDIVPDTPDITPTGSPDFEANGTAASHPDTIDSSAGNTAQTAADPNPSDNTDGRTDPYGIKDTSEAEKSEIVQNTDDDSMHPESSGVVNSSPVFFAHGTGKFDVLVPPHYNIWISVRSRDCPLVLFVGADGMPLPYRFQNNMIYIKSDDIPPGHHLIQVLAANAAGQIFSMSDYAFASYI